MITYSSGTTTEELHNLAFANLALPNVVFADLDLATVRLASSTLANRAFAMLGLAFFVPAILASVKLAVANVA